MQKYLAGDGGLYRKGAIGRLFADADISSKPIHFTTEDAHLIVADQTQDPCAPFLRTNIYSDRKNTRINKAKDLTGCAFTYYVK